MNTFFTSIFRGTLIVTLLVFGAFKQCGKLGDRGSPASDEINRKSLIKINKLKYKK